MTDLLGKVWIASFVFTRCTAGCPQISTTMKRLQGDLSGYPDVRLVTFTVDPEHDDPGELSRYADAYGADPERWLFLTGEARRNLSAVGEDVSPARSAQRGVGASPAAR